MRKTKLYREANLKSVFCAVILLLSVGSPSEAMAARPEDQICDAAADYSLGLEGSSDISNCHNPDHANLNDAPSAKPEQQRLPLNRWEKI